MLISRAAFRLRQESIIVMDKDVMLKELNEKIDGLMIELDGQKRMAACLRPGTAERARGSV